MNNCYVACLILFLSFQGFAYTAPVPASLDLSANHAATREDGLGEILIGLKPISADQMAVSAKSAGGMPTSVTLTPSLKTLARRFGAERAQALFPKATAARARMDALARKAPSRLSSAERRLLIRRARAPRSASISRLEGIVKLKINLAPGQTLEHALEDFRNDPAVAFAEPDQLITLQAVPNDPRFAQQWPLSNTGQMYPSSNQYTSPPGRAGCDIKALEAWAQLSQDQRPIIAVVDTGVDLNHRDLAANLWINEAEKNGRPGVDDDANGYIDDLHGYKFDSFLDPGETTAPMDDFGHGTHAAGIIAAVSNNALDIAGVCPQGLIMALKFMDHRGNGGISHACEAIRYATDQGADIISCSFGANDWSETLAQTIAYAISQGVIVVAAAGNENVDALLYPASLPQVISVSATDSRDQRASFTNYGGRCDVSAPGVDILSLRAAGTSMGAPQDEYLTVASGSSMACPHVAGVAALVLQQRPGITVDEMRALLMLTSDPVTDSRYLGQGRVNAARALREAGSALPIASLQVSRPQAFSGALKGALDLTGTAAGAGFTSYTLSCNAQTSPGVWRVLKSSTAPVTSSTLLAGFHTLSLMDGKYTLRLDVADKLGRVLSVRQQVTIYNITWNRPQSNDMRCWGDLLEIRVDHPEPVTPDSVEWGRGLTPQSWSKAGLTLTSGENGLLGRWDTAATGRPGVFALRCRFHTRFGPQELLMQFIMLETTIKRGWPQYIPYETLAYERETIPTVADLDGDGRQEVAIVEPGTFMKKHPALCVYRADGSLAWRRELDAGTMEMATGDFIAIPVAGDLDGDGRQELVVHAGQKYDLKTRDLLGYPLYAFRYDGGLMPGWPLLLPGCAREKLIADVNHDGRGEIVAATTTYEASFFYVIDGAGRMLTQTPRVWNGETFIAPRTLAVGNFDSDPALETALAWSDHTPAPYEYRGETVSLLNPDGSALPGWPLPLKAYAIMNLVTGDINRDGYDELFFFALSDPSGGKPTSGVYCVDRFGQTLPGWPVLTDSTSEIDPSRVGIALGDLDGDKVPEVVVNCKTNTYLYDAQGRLNPNCPLRPVQWHVTESQLSIGDAIMDARPEIVFSAGQFVSPLSSIESGGVGFFSATGVYTYFSFEEKWYSLLTHEGSSDYSRVTLADLDNNGKVDLIANSTWDVECFGLGRAKNRNSLYVWEINTPWRPQTMQWPTWQHDAARTGRYTPPPPPRTATGRAWTVFE